MSAPCKNCGRNTATVAEPLEWRSLTFCTPACLASYQKAHGVAAKNLHAPSPKRSLAQRLSALPTPLKIVVWLNLVLAATSLITWLSEATALPLQGNVQNGLDILLSVLIVIGILQASRLIRIIVLVFSWIAVISTGIAFFFAISQIGLHAAIVLLPFSISAVTIWGLSTQRSKAYFGY